MWRTLTAILASASCAVAATSKRGLSESAAACAGTFCADFAAGAGVLTWSYSWGLVPADLSCGSQVAFQPMVWGSNAAANVSAAYVSDGTRFLLGFNEPNAARQSNLTPADAAALWPAVSAVAKAKNLSLVAPVPSGRDTAWLDSFFSLCNCEADVSRIALHPYDCTASGLTSSLDAWSKYGKPLWVTEFNCGDDEANATAKQHLEWMRIALPLLDADDRVERYAWMSGRDTKVPGCALFSGPAGQLTELGKLYVTA